MCLIFVARAVGHKTRLREAQILLFLFKKVGIVFGLTDTAAGSGIFFFVPETGCSLD